MDKPEIDLKYLYLDLSDRVIKVEDAIQENNEQIADQVIAVLEKRSGLFSPFWINRVFTAWAYVLLAQLVIIGIVVGLFLLFKLFI